MAVVDGVSQVCSTRLGDYNFWSIAFDIATSPPLKSAILKCYSGPQRSCHSRELWGAECSGPRGRYLSRTDCNLCHFTADSPGDTVSTMGTEWGAPYAVRPSVQIQGTGNGPVHLTEMNFCLWKFADFPTFTGPPHHQFHCFSYLRSSFDFLCLRNSHNDIRALCHWVPLMFAGSVGFTLGV
jgi:hypothetical protein